MKQIIFLLSIFLNISFVFADIYMYVDEKGQKNFVNQPKVGAELVKGLSPTKLDGTEDVQTLLSAPRFNRKISMDGDKMAFRGHYPKPFMLRDKNDELKLREVRLLNKQHDMIARKQNIRQISEEKRQMFAPHIESIARQHGVPPALVHAVISVESAYNAKARSHAGAQGLMQLMPATARSLGVKDAFDPVQNIQGGVAYLQFLLERFGDVSLALAGYNAGPGAVAKYGNKIPPYKETQAYVPRVLAYYYRYLEE